MAYSQSWLFQETSYQRKLITSYKSFNQIQRDKFFKAKKLIYLNKMLNNKLSTVMKNTIKMKSKNQLEKCTKNLRKKLLKFNQSVYTNRLKNILLITILKYNLSMYKRESIFAFYVFFFQKGILLVWTQPLIYMMLKLTSA